jgi:protein gp37
MSARRSISSRREKVSGPDSETGGIARARPVRGECSDASWNPTAGCTLYSPGCDHCYAMRIAARLARMGGETGARYAGLTRMERGGPVWTGHIRVLGDLLTWPLFRRRPRRIAVSSRSDLFHENLATAMVDLLHAVMVVAHWHCFLVLTKRATRMRLYYSDPETPRRIAREVDFLSSVILPIARGRSAPAPGRTTGSALTADPVASRASRPGGDPGADATGVFSRSAENAARAIAVGAPRHWIAGLSRVKYGAPGSATMGIHPVGLDPWPLPNLWPGVSVEDHNRIARVLDLLETPAAIRWVCFEPLLDRVKPDAVPFAEGYFDALAGGHYVINGRGRAVPVDGPAWRPLDWVVAGGEIGAGARPMHPDWVRTLRDKCVAASIPFFFKRWGEWAPAPKERSSQTMIRVGERDAGRLLDGRTWDEMPPPARAR